jgi:hypothetical protein
MAISDKGVLGAASRSALSVVVVLMLCGSQNFNRHVSIINNTGQNLVEIHVATAGGSAWGFDQLGDDLLTAGDAKIWALGDGKGHCRFDFAFMLRDRSIIRKKAINVCGRTAIYVAEAPHRIAWRSDSQRKDRPAETAAHPTSVHGHSAARGTIRSTRDGYVGLQLDD